MNEGKAQIIERIRARCMWPNHVLVDNNDDDDDDDNDDNDNDNNNNYGTGSVVK